MSTKTSNNIDTNLATTPIKQEVYHLKRDFILIFDKQNLVKSELAKTKVKLWRANNSIRQLDPATTPPFSTPSHPHPLAPQAPSSSKS